MTKLSADYSATYTLCLWQLDTLFAPVVVCYNVTKADLVLGQHDFRGPALSGVRRSTRLSTRP